MTKIVELRSGSASVVDEGEGPPVVLVHGLPGSVPTLAAWCADDALIEAQILAELAQALPPGPRLVWPHGGHNPQKTHAATLAAGIGELL